MNLESKDFAYSKINKRKFSTFIASELIYDFHFRKVHENEFSALEQVILNDPKLKKDLENIITAENYLEKMSSVEISQNIFTYFNAPVGYLDGLIEKMKINKWPSVVKVGIESLVVVVLMASVFAVTPWEKFIQWINRSTQSEVVLSEFVRQKTVNLDSPDIPVDSSVQPFQDENANKTVNSEKKKPSIQASNQIKNETQATANLNSEKSEPKENINATTEATIDPSIDPTIGATEESAAKSKNEDEGEIEAEATIAQESPQSTEEAEKAVTEINKASKNKKQASVSSGESGFLYRGIFKVTNLETVTHKITEKIMELGGRKAGNVEIGWKKGPNSYYYHFTMPEAKYGELSNYLALYGKPSLSKDPHGRVMPEGIIRILMTIEEKEEQ